MVIANTDNILTVQKNGTGIEAFRKVTYEGIELGEMRYHADKLEDKGKKLDSILKVEFNGENLFYSNPDLNNDEARTRAGNSAYRKLKKIGLRDGLEVLYRAFEAEDFHTDLSTFALKAISTYTEGDISELMVGNPDKKIEMLLPWAIEGGTTIAFGSPKVGKSFFGLNACLHLDSGNGPLWDVRDKSPSMYINLERRADFLEIRLGRMNAAYGLNSRRPMRVTHLKGKGPFKMHADSIRKEIKKYGIKFIVIDSITAMGFGDFNDNFVGSQLGRLVDYILEGSDATCLLLGHSSKGHQGEGKETLLGAQSQTAFADVMLRLRSSRNPDNESELGIRAEMVGQNDASPTEMPVTVMGFDRFGVNKVRKGSLNEFPALKEDYIGALDPKKRIEYVLQLEDGPMQVKDIFKELKGDVPQGTISRILGDHNDTFVKTGDGKRSPWKLRKDGNIYP